MYLTSEQQDIGTLNFLTALGELRRDFLRKSLDTAAVGPYYFGYPKLDGRPVRAGIVGVGGEGREALIQQSSPAYLQYVAYHDIRPSQIAAAPKYFTRLYGADEAKQVKFYERWEEMLADKSIEAIVVATPLWTHARFAIEALLAGKHVLCEKLMAHNISDAKRMVRTAEKEKKILAIGHQRHYSTLYANALEVVRSGVLGEIKHIRALWHRNNTFLNEDRTFHDGWSPAIPDADKNVDYQKYGYRSLKELVRWRLYNRTGGGLMAELGSHQLDACSIFLGKVHPVSVSGVGGKYFYTDDRECEDHVYCDFEMPDGVVITYSSINTNALEGYGEVVMGTRGTLMVLNERDVMLFKEREKGDKNPAEDMHTRPTKTEDGKTKLAAAEGWNVTGSAALAKEALEKASIFTPVDTTTTMGNRGYHEEIEAFAAAIRHPGTDVRCNGRVALADTVMALTANIAMRTREKIKFDPAWYDPNSEAVPDAVLSMSPTGKA